MTVKPVLVLASTSPRRREVLSNLRLRFRVVAPHANELSGGEREPSEVALENARRKAVSVRGLLRTSGPGEERVQGVRNVVVGVDTIVVKGRTLLSKPADQQDARRMLEFLSGTTHKVMSGLHVASEPGGPARGYLSTTQVTFRALSEDEISAYLELGEYRDKAGAYGIQGAAALFVERLEGCYFNVVGMPVSALRRGLADLGVDIRLLQDAPDHSKRPGEPGKGAAR